MWSATLRSWMAEQATLVASVQCLVGTTQSDYVQLVNSRLGARNQESDSTSS